MEALQPNQLPAGDVADFADDGGAFVADNDLGITVHLTAAQLRTLLGSIIISGAVVGSGVIGSTVTVTLANGTVTLVKMADIASNKLLGRSTARTGIPEVISIGAGLTLAAGVLSAAAPAAAAPSATLHTHRAFGEF